MRRHEHHPELGAYCRERGLFPEQMVRWRQAAQDANAHSLVPMAEQKVLEKCHQEDQSEIKRPSRTWAVRTWC